MSKLYFARTYGLKYNHMIVSKNQKKANQGLEKWWNKYCKADDDRTFKNAVAWYGFCLNSSDGSAIKLDKPFYI